MAESPPTPQPSPSTGATEPEALAATHAAAFRQSRPWSASEFVSLIQDRFTFVAGEARCFALVRVVAGEAELLTIATHPDHQRQGLAFALMNQWLAMAAQRGAEEAFLEVAADNTAAKALYTSCGFALVGIRKSYYSRPKESAEDALLMKRPFP